MKYFSKELVYNKYCMLYNISRMKPKNALTFNKVQVYNKYCIISRTKLKNALIVSLNRFSILRIPF